MRSVPTTRLLDGWFVHLDVPAAQDVQIRRWYFGGS